MMCKKFIESYENSINEIEQILLLIAKSIEVSGLSYNCNGLFPCGLTMFYKGVKISRIEFENMKKRIQ